MSAPLLRVPAGLATGRWQGGCTTRIGFPSAQAGDDSRRASREILARALGREAADFAWLKQMHGADVRIVEGRGLLGEADALLSNKPAAMLLISVADCCPVLLWQPRGKLFAAAHAGWRGLVAGVLPRTVETLVREGAEPSSLRAWIGPSISVEHFEVGDEVAEQFDSRFVRPAGDGRERPHVDLKAAARHELVEVGLEPEAIDVCPDCTYERADLYWSYRRDGGICGRLIAYLGLRA